MAAKLPFIQALAKICLGIEHACICCCSLLGPEANEGMDRSWNFVVCVKVCTSCTHMWKFTNFVQGMCTHIYDMWTHMWAYMANHRTYYNVSLCAWAQVFQPCVHAEACNALGASEHHGQSRKRAREVRLLNQCGRSPEAAAPGLGDDSCPTAFAAEHLQVHADCTQG